jgi:hypothetical protein
MVTMTARDKCGISCDAMRPRADWIAEAVEVA